MSLQWLTLFILISSYITNVRLNAENPCSGSSFHGSTSFVCGVIGGNINLTCNVPTNCERGFWKHENTINRTWLFPEMDVGPNYHLSCSPLQALNFLRITNISDSLTGVYTCFCDDKKRNRTAFACFNVSVQCDISVQINNEKSNFDTCSVSREVEMIAVKVNENISIKCGHNMKKNIRNCSLKKKEEAFTVDTSHHLCSFSCQPKRRLKNKCQAKWVTLNVTNPSTSSSTGMTTNYQTSELLSFQMFSTLGPSKPETIATNKNSMVKSAGTPSPSSVTSLPTSSDHPVSSTTINTPKHTTKSTSKIPTNTSNIFCENSSGTRSATPFPFSGTTLQQNISYGLNTPVLIIVTSCIVFVLSFIVLILGVHIIFYKKGVRSCNNKEEWVNPLYESADNRAELPIALPDEGNVYNTINSPDNVTKFSSTESASNNVHKIDPDLGRTNELTMVQLKASENVGITATHFGAHSMEFKKPKCKQIDTSLTAADETLNVPNVGDTSPPPASPHFYEMFK